MTFVLLFVLHSKSTMQYHRTFDSKYMKYHTSPYRVMVIGKYMFVDSLIEYIGPPNCVPYHGWTSS